jgi:hypothetical protein
MNDPLPIQALEAFSARLQRGSLVLCLEPQVGDWLARRGIEVQYLPEDKDLRLLSLKRESYDGVWAGSALASHAIEDAQRVIATFFQALRPAGGMLFAAHSFPEPAFASLLRQNGFSIQLSGQNKDRLAVVSQRI